MPTSAAAEAPRRRYLTLAAARALACNGCGDCCDSTRSGGFWTWGALPQHQYRDRGGGEPLIIPLEPHARGWRDRAWRPQDASAAAPTPFRCTAFRPQPDGRGLCAIHDRERPALCGEFPVHTRDLEADLAARGIVRLETSAFPRCTWHRVAVIAADDPAIDACRGCIDSDGHVALGALPPSLLARWGMGAAAPPVPPAPPARS